MIQNKFIEEKRLNRQVVNQSIDYILEHFDENLTVRDVAAHFHFSEFYFCRSFKSMTGKSVYEFIMRLKMDQSAVDIKLRRNERLIDIGFDYGYSPSNFCAAFRKFHHVSPLVFRKMNNVSGRANPFYISGCATFDSYEDYSRRIQIQQIRNLTVIYERFIGSYADLKQQWPAFLKRYQEYITPGALFLERFYDDPAIAQLDTCVYDICVTVEGDCALENQTTIPGGKYAVYHYEGSIPDIFCSIQGVFTVWLPQSGYTMARRYGLNVYPKMPENADAVVFELCIPIK